MATRVEQAGLADRIIIDSAGTGDWHIGDTPDERATAEASSRRVRMRSRARQVEITDFETFDLVLAMDSHNLRDLRSMAPDDSAIDKIHLLRSFDPPGSSADPPDPTTARLDVPDPYFGGPEGFAQVFDLIDKACTALLDHIVETDPRLGSAGADQAVER